MSFGKSGRDDKESTSQIPSSVIASQGMVTSGVAAHGRPEAFLGRGCKIVGTLTFAGPVEIEGTVEGEIIAHDKLTIGESAVVKGRITGSEVIVKGEVQGDISASKRLSLRRPARVVGNLACAILSIDEGVIFEGKCQMASASSAGKDILGKDGQARDVQVKDSQGKDSRAAVVSITDRVA